MNIFHRFRRFVVLWTYLLLHRNQLNNPMANNDTRRYCVILQNGRLTIN